MLNYKSQQYCQNFISNYLLGNSGGDPPPRKNWVLTSEKWKFLNEFIIYETWHTETFLRGSLTRDFKSQNFSYLGGVLFTRGVLLNDPVYRCTSRLKSHVG